LVAAEEIMIARRRLLFAMAVLLSVLVISAVPVAGQAAPRGTSAPGGPVPRRADGKPDLTGRWSGSLGSITHTNLIEEHAAGFGVLAGKSLIIDPPDGIIPYTPAALALRNENRLDINAYRDPTSHCEFYGMARLHQFVQEFLHADDNKSIIIYAQQHITRIIPMDGRQHLPDSIRLWMGDPIGHWEGDTLVIDVTNFNGKTWMGFGDYHGADAHIVERFTMVDSNTINWAMTITNPKVFTRPWTMTSAAPFKRVAGRGDDLAEEDACHEHNVDLVHLKNVYDQARRGAASK
jgi:hypothetical protein